MSIGYASSVQTLHILPAEEKSREREALPAMPLTMAPPNQTMRVLSVCGKEDTRRFLENLGFVEGSQISVVSKLCGNVIVSVKDSRIAISKTMASRIYACGDKSGASYAARRGTVS